MFRYLALSWDSTIPGQASRAKRLGETLASRRDWQPALLLSNLHVYVTGGASGVNGVYDLPARQGVILGRLFRRSDVNPSSGDAEITTLEGERIVHTDGKALIDEFWGRYVAFLPSWTGEGRVLRDPSGTLPCFRLQVDGVTIVFSWLEDVFELLRDVPILSVNWDALAAYMVLGRLSGRETALEGVTQILPGELTTLGLRGTMPLALWNAVEMAGAPDTQGSAQNTAERLRHAVLTCAQRWAGCYESILLRLSGGVDSSILLGSLSSEPSATKVTCLNYHSPGSDSDERGFARLAASRAGRVLIERERDVGFRLDAVLDQARTPLPASYIGRMGTGSVDAAVAAAHGAPAMFTGGGGDQLFFELQCTWPAADFLKLRGLSRGFFGATLESARLGRVSFWRSLAKAIADRSYRANPVDAAGSFITLTSGDALDLVRQRPQRFIHPHLFQADRLPIGKYHQVDALLCPLDYYDPFVRDAAPELVNPLLSQPLVELSLRTPTYVLASGGRGRGLARDAFASDIPHEIAYRRSKGGMEEHVEAILQKNLPLARELLLDGHLACRGLIDRRRVEAALSGGPSAGDVYVSEIHNCIAVEAWLRRFEGA